MIQLGLLLALAVAPGDEATRWHRVVRLLEYVEGDFAGALASGSSDELREQQGFLSEVVKQLEAAGPEGARWVEAARGLEAALVTRDPALGQRCGELARDIVAGLGLSRAPRHAPQLERGAALFKSACEGCHGTTGQGDGSAGAMLEPPPALWLTVDTVTTQLPQPANTSLPFLLLSPLARRGRSAAFRRARRRARLVVPRSLRRG